ncbi:MAG: glucose 1-dehydrogenase [Rhodocyclaceae bacterium]|jgi:NAD(P)-dependent dehydrogenase (short-subunit alcohol dehydrogenase family)|nr:glucose 1-dehydrogenase [Rhodocyclaceae bacterium]
MTGILTGKVALVTGGASGIGRASALALAREGARVVVVDLSIEGGEGTAAAIVAAGGAARFIPTDVTRSADLQAAVACAVHDFGGLDIALNNAGILAGTSLLAEEAEALFDKVLAVNVKSVMLAMKHEIPEMLKRGGGAIINTASTMGLVGSVGGNWAYTASKHAVLGLTKSVAVEYAARGIRVNAICPGAVHTPMMAGRLANPAAEQAVAAIHPIGRVAQPEEIAAAVVWLASPGASYMVGAALPVDGGFTAI